MNTNSQAQAENLEKSLDWGLRKFQIPESMNWVK